MNATDNYLFKQLISKVLLLYKYQGVTCHAWNVVAELGFGCKTDCLEL
jgi:hypothetical protein